ncbi:MAG: ester cyclase [Bacteroidota bacterium]
MKYLKVLIPLCWLFLSFSSCAQVPDEHKLDAAAKKELVFKFIQLMETKEFSRFDEVIANDYRQHNPMVKQGLEGIREGASWFLSVFPDLSASIDEIVVEGDLVAARITWTGTHRGELFGIPASGEKISWTGADWWRIKEGKFVEHWDVVDWSQVLNQISKKKQ